MLHRPRTPSLLLNLLARVLVTSIFEYILIGIFYMVIEVHQFWRHPCHLKPERARSPRSGKSTASTSPASLGEPGTSGSKIESDETA